MGIGHGHGDRHTVGMDIDMNVDLNMDVNILEKKNYIRHWTAPISETRTFSLTKFLPICWHRTFNARCLLPGGGGG
jgi:hypothetical protein